MPYDEIDYKVITSEMVASTLEFELEVENHLRIGWQLAGGISTVIANNRVMLLQAVYRNSNDHDSSKSTHSYKEPT